MEHLNPVREVLLDCELSRSRLHRNPLCETQDCQPTGLPAPPFIPNTLWMRPPSSPAEIKCRQARATGRRTTLGIGGMIIWSGLIWKSGVLYSVEVEVPFPVSQGCEDTHFKNLFLILVYYVRREKGVGCNATALAPIG